MYIIHSIIVEKSVLFLSFFYIFFFVNKFVFFINSFSMHQRNIYIYIHMSIENCISSKLSLPSLFNKVQCKIYIYTQVYCSELWKKNPEVFAIQSLLSWLSSSSVVSFISIIFIIVFIIIKLCISTHRQNWSCCTWSCWWPKMKQKETWARL